MTQCCDLHFSDLGDVAKVGDVRVAMRQNGTGKRVDFRHTRALPAERHPGFAGGLDAAEQREEPHGCQSFSGIWHMVASASIVITSMP